MSRRPDLDSVWCVCGTATRSKIFRIEGLRIRGSECPKCGEGYLNPDEAQKLSDFRRLKDIVLTGKVTKTGNSYALRLPMVLVRALRLERGRSVTIRLKGEDEILLTVVGPPKPT